MPRRNVTSRKVIATIQRAEERYEKASKEAPARGLLARRLLRVLVLALLLAIIASPPVLPKFSVIDNDAWLHLKVGDWIVEHSAVPHTGIFPALPPTALGRRQLSLRSVV